MLVKTSPPGKEIKVFKIIDFFLKQNTDYKDMYIHTLLNNINDTKILDKLLRTIIYTYEVVVTSLKKLKLEFDQKSKKIYFIM